MSPRLSILLPRSLRTQLACAFVLLGVVLAVTLSVALGAMLMHKGRQEADASLRSSAQNSARLLAEGLFRGIREVQVLAESPTLWVEGLDAERVSQALYRSQAVNPHSAWIGVADRAGVVRVATGQVLVGADVKARPWFAAGMNGLHVGDVHPAKLLARLLPPGSDGGPQRFVDFAAPIRRDGELLGVLCVHGSWEWTRETIESLLPAAQDRRSLEVFVFDRQGQMIYAPDSILPAQQKTGQTLPLAPMLAVVDPSHVGAAAVVRWRDGQDYLTAASAMEARSAASDLGWTVVARQPVSVAHAAARDGALMALLIGLLAAVLSSVFGWRLAKRLTRPLRRIARDAQAVEAADTPFEMPRRPGSLEIEQLSGALTGMTQRLLHANANLERRVQDRTAELERANAALEQLAHHDPLTGLLNRRGLHERLVAALSSARRRQAPLSLMIVDADHFKQVNDRFGHDVGDQVLLTIGRVLRKRLREVDFVARIGGEEFVVVLPDTGELGAAHVAEALLMAVQHTPMPGAGQVTLSGGVAEMRVDDETPEAALQRADAALYRAKQTGRNRFCMAAAAAADKPPLEVLALEPATQP